MTRRGRGILYMLFQNHTKFFFNSYFVSLLSQLFKTDETLIKFCEKFDKIMGTSDIIFEKFV